MLISDEFVVFRDSQHVIFEIFQHTERDFLGGYHRREIRFDTLVLQCALNRYAGFNDASLLIQLGQRVCSEDNIEGAVCNELLHQLFEELVVLAPRLHGVGAGQHMHRLKHVHKKRGCVDGNGVELAGAFPGSMLECFEHLIRVSDDELFELIFEGQFLAGFAVQVHHAFLVTHPGKSHALASC